jgi:PAS domain S-box-containing protein
MLGYSSEDLQQRTIANCVFPEDIATTRLRINNNLAGQHEQFELRFRRHDGSALSTLASTSPIYAADGTITGGLCLFTDITAHKRVEEELRQSEELLRVTLRNAPIAIFRQDLDLRYTWMYNPPSSTPASVIGKFDADFVPPEVASHLKQIKRHVLVTGESVHEEILTPSIHGTRFELLSLEPLRDNEGTIIGLTGTSINITERKQLEQRTHRALEALLAMAEAMVQRSETGNETQDQSKSEIRSVARQIAVLARDVLGSERLSMHQLEPDTERMLPLATIGLSPAMEEEWWQQQEQNMLPLSARFGETLATRLHKQEVLIIDMTQSPYSEYPNPFGIHTMLIAPLSLNGHLLGLLELDYSGAAHEYTPEEIALTQATCRLIALVIERQQLLASNQRLSELIEQAHDAVIVRDAESCIEFWNKGAERLYGWTKEEAMGQSTHTLLATRFPVAYENLENSLATRGQWEGILQHSRRDGTPLTVESRQVLVRDATGRPSPILEINRDITERERLARERAEAQASERALREANQLMDEFIGIAGHELRTPLTSVKTSVQLARRQLNRVLKQNISSADAQGPLTLVQGHLERSERQIGMQNRLISDLLDVSRIHSGRLELHPDLCNLVTLVREVVEDQRYITSERTIELISKNQNELLVLVDADRVRQVISNYLSNALKYSEAARPVIIHVEARDMQVRVSVRDEGPGLSKEQQKHVWERFYRVPDIEVKTGSGVGLGLGLHISRMIIERQGGQVGVESDPGKGSTFWFTLPLAEPA